MFIVILLGLFSEARAQERRNTRLGTATTSELPHAVGVTLAALIKLKLLPSTGIDINAQNTGGSKENARLVGDGALDFAIVASPDARDIAFDAVADDDAGSNGGESGVLMLTNLWSEGVHLIVRQDLVPSGNFSDFLALRDLKISFGDRDGVDFDDGLALFNAFELDAEQVHEVLNLGRQEAPAALASGELDAFLLKSRASEEDLLAFLDEAGPTVAPLNVGEDELERLNARGPEAWTTIDVVIDGATGETALHRSIAMTHQLVAAASVDEEVVYQITKTIFDNLPVLSGMHDATDSINLENGLRQVVLPVHPGAARYYREIGLEVPDPAPVRVSNLAAAGFLKRFATAEAARLELTDSNISILGGQEGQTIGRFTSELASDLRDDDVRVLSMLSPDPANNIAQVLYAKGVDSAFVPLDILNYAAEQNIYPGVRSKLVYTTELFSQEFHLLVAPEIETIEDLIDKRVNLGIKDSGSEFTAAFLFDRFNIPVEPTYYEPREALARLRQGELSAVVMVAGKPAPLLTEIDVADGLRLLAVPPLEGSAYRPAVIESADYPFILEPGETVDTFSVRTALMTYNWRSDNPRYVALSSFITAFFDKLSSLQGEALSLHPKWRDINPFAELQGWQRFSGAEDWLNNGRPPEGQSESQ